MTDVVIEEPNVNLFVSGDAGRVVVDVTTVVVAITEETVAPVAVTEDGGQIHVYASGQASPSGSTWQEVPAGVVDGVNPTFVLSSLPVVYSVQLFVNGLLQLCGYGLTGPTITFESQAIPQSGDSVWAIYQR